MNEDSAGEIMLFIKQEQKLQTSIFIHDTYEQILC